MYYKTVSKFHARKITTIFCFPTAGIFFLVRYDHSIYLFSKKGFLPGMKSTSVLTILISDYNQLELFINDVAVVAFLALPRKCKTYCMCIANFKIRASL